MKKLFLVGLVLFLSACSMGENAKGTNKATATETPASEVLTDEKTKLSIEMVEAKENTKLVDWESDAMDRGNHDYNTMVHSSLVVDMGYQEVIRGDVVYYKTPESAINNNPQLPEYYIARVVGLPGETVEIREGQVYVENQKLDAFYGVARDRGLDKDEYFKILEQNLEEGTWTTDEEISKREMITWVNVDGKKEDFATSMEPVKISNAAVFVLVDQWWRGTDSKDFGELSLEAIEGKVLGYAKK